MDAKGVLLRAIFDKNIHEIICADNGAYGNIFDSYLFQISVYQGLKHTLETLNIPRTFRMAATKPMVKYQAWYAIV